MCSSSTRDNPLEGQRHVRHQLAAARKERPASRLVGCEGKLGAQRFEGESRAILVTGRPFLCEAIASFDCGPEELIERHTHAVVIGAVVGPRATRSPVGAANSLATHERTP